MSRSQWYQPGTTREQDTECPMWDTIETNPSHPCQQISILILDPAQSVVISSPPGPFSAGSSVNLDCEVMDGNPTPILKWFRDSGEVGTAPRLSFVAQVEDHTKEVRCDGINTVDTISQAITLQVLCKLPCRQASE